MSAISHRPVNHRAVAYRHAEPIATINITPMIDVMLVLLVMLILTIPVMTHKVEVDLPAGGKPSVQAPPHRLEIARDGAVAWDGRGVGDAELARLLSAAAVDPGKPVLHMRTDPETRYERFDQVLANVKTAGITRLGFVGDSALVR